MFGTGSRHVGPPWTRQTGLNRSEQTIRNRRGSEDHLRIRCAVTDLCYLRKLMIWRQTGWEVTIISDHGVTVCLLSLTAVLYQRKQIFQRSFPCCMEKKPADQQFREFKLCMLRHFLCDKQLNNITSGDSVNSPSSRSRLFGIFVSLFG